MESGRVLSGSCSANLRSTCWHQAEQTGVTAECRSPGECRSQGAKGKWLEKQSTQHGSHSRTLPSHRDLLGFTVCKQGLVSGMHLQVRCVSCCLRSHEGASGAVRGVKPCQSHVFTCPSHLSTLIQPPQAGPRCWANVALACLGEWVRGRKAHPFLPEHLGSPGLGRSTTVSNQDGCLIVCTTVCHLTEFSLGWVTGEAEGLKGQAFLCVGSKQGPAVQWTQGSDLSS